MKIQLLSRTPNAIKLAFTAIRTCYSPHNADHIWNKDYPKYVAKNDDHIRLIKQIANHGHLSTLEHISFTFAVEDVTRVLLAQLTRHRIGFSYSVQSQRYVKMSEDSKHGGFNYFVPHQLKAYELDNRYHALMDQVQNLYDDMVSHGVKAEDARMVLPNATYTNLIMTVNLRAFLDFYGKRNLSTHAQSEIAHFAEEIKKIVVEAEPWIEQLID